METRVGDIVLIYHGSSALGFARVEDIVADPKPNWWQISLMLLKVPPQYVTWILREEYIDGHEFSMGGEVMRLQRQPRPGGPHLVFDAESEDDGGLLVLGGKRGPAPTHSSHPCPSGAAARETNDDSKEESDGESTGAKVIVLRPRNKPKTNDPDQAS